MAGDLTIKEGQRTTSSQQLFPQRGFFSAKISRRSDGLGQQVFAPYCLSNCYQTNAILKQKKIPSWKMIQEEVVRWTLTLLYFQITSHNEIQIPNFHQWKPVFNLKSKSKNSQFESLKYRSCPLIALRDFFAFRMEGQGVLRFHLLLLLLLGTFYFFG